MPENYTLGLHEVADGCHAYLQPNGSWGWSNAGLVVGDGVSLLVDTLFDLQLTRRMLDVDGTRSPTRRRSPRSSTPTPTAITATATSWSVRPRSSPPSATAHEMTEVPPSMLAGLNSAPGEVGDLFRTLLRRVRLRRHRAAPADRTFDGRLDLEVGGRSVELIEVGPAHTSGDTLAYVPDARTIYHRRHPVHRRHADRVGRSAQQLGRGVRPDARAWTSTSSCPATARSPTRRGIAAVRDYLSFVDEAQATGMRRASMPGRRPARSRPRSRRGRISVRSASSVASPSTSTPCTGTSIPAYESPNVVEQFRRMAVLENYGSAIGT